MDLRQIRNFVALCEEKSITKAARRLHVVQPAVSMQIKRIEIEHGVSLFERTSSGVYPNSTAQAIYPYCLEILSAVEKVGQMLRDSSGTLSGTLVFGVPPSIAHGILADLLFEFQTLHPSVRLSANEGYSAHLIDWLLQGDLDFAILSERENDPRLHCEPIVTEELLVLCHVDTPIVNNRILGKELAQLKLVIPSAKNLIRILIDTAFEQQNIRLEPKMEMDSLAAVVAAVRHPGWASILPACAILQDNLANDLRSVVLEEPNIHRTLFVAYPTLKPLPPAARQFTSLLKSSIERIGCAVNPDNSG